MLIRARESAHTRIHTRILTTRFLMKKNPIIYYENYSYCNTLVGIA